MLDTLTYQDNCGLIRQTIIDITQTLDGKHPKLSEAMNLLIASKYFKIMNPNGLKSIIYLIENKGYEFAYNYLFNKRTATKEDVDRYRTNHEMEYEDDAEVYSNILIENEGEVLITEGGMYGGKSSLTRMIIERILKKDPSFKTYTFVPHFMNEPFVTIRGKKGVDGKENHEVPAKQLDVDPKSSNYGNWIKIIDEIALECPDGKAVIHFDEYSFIQDENVVREIITDAQSKGFRIILAGLNTDFLGRVLKGFSAAKTIANHLVVCKSFVTGQADEIPEEGQKYTKPRGFMTSRFITLDNGLVIRDMAFAETVVEKEITSVGYIPETEEDHVTGWLDPQILFALHNPSAEDEVLQKELKERIIADFIAKMNREKEA